MDPPMFIRDPNYYLQNGDLVILVESTLFRVHRFILCRDSSTFENMLEVCTGSEGSDDDNPLQLHGDTAKAIRSLLSMLYALPNKLQTKCKAFVHKSGLDGLLTLAEITNKYHFSSSERLLMKILDDHVQTNFQHLQNNATVDDLMRALRVSIMQDATFVQLRLSSVLVGRLLDRSVPADVSLKFAITHSHRPLQGAAYYAYLMETTPENGGEAGLDVIKFGEEIDNDLKLRLLHGYWSLMRTCLRLRSTPPIDLPTCETLGITDWYRSYDVSFNASSPDLLKLLRKIKQYLSRWCEAHVDAMTMDGMASARAVVHLDREIERVRENLMDYFEYQC